MAPDDYPVICEACRHFVCACAQTVEDIDAWADAYLGTDAHAQDYLQGQESARRFLANLRTGEIEPPRPPEYLDALEREEEGHDTGTILL